MREIMQLNFGWRFSPDFKPEYTGHDFKDTSFRLVDIPHSTADISRSHVSSKAYGSVVCYRKTFVMPSAYIGKHIILYFDGVMGCAAAFFNGKPVCAHKGGFTPFRCDVTDLVRTGDNVITVVVDSTERDDTPPFGGKNDMLCAGGIYREVRLEALDDTSVEFINAATRYDGSYWSVDIRGNLVSECEAGMTFYLFDADGRKISAKYFKCDKKDFSCSWVLPCDVVEWSCEVPVLYSLKAVSDSGDEHEIRIGFRRAQFRHDGFYLGDKKIKLFALARHQNYGVCGGALPASAQRADADLLKELGCNAVFTDHCPPSDHFLDRCDEIGLLVIEDIPAFGHIGGEEWKNTLCDNLSELILRDMNHPSVILRNIKPGGAPDDAALEKELASIARKLDPATQLCGLHTGFGPAGEEDVFIYRDPAFGSENSALEKRRSVTRAKIPYIAFVGSSARSCAKSFDRMPRLTKQAMRHAKALDSAYGDGDLCGVIACCLSDFIACDGFGAENRICACGITDIDRFPKPAAHLWMTQRSDKPMLFVPPGFSAEERSEVWVYTNADEVRVTADDRLLGKFSPNTKLFPNLPHPPILIEDPERLLLSSSKVVFAGIVKSEVVASVTSGSLRKKSLVVTQSSETLHHGDTYDTARIELEAVDGFGQRLPYCFDAVSVECEGSIEPIGGKLFSLRGGTGAVYIRTKGGKGNAVVRICTESLGEYSVSFSVTRTLPPKEASREKIAEPDKAPAIKNDDFPDRYIDSDAPPPVVVEDFDEGVFVPPSSEVKGMVSAFNQKVIKRDRKNK